MRQLVYTNKSAWGQTLIPCAGTGPRRSGGVACVRPIRTSVAVGLCLQPVVSPRWTRPRFRFGSVRAPHEPPTSGGYA